MDSTDAVPQFARDLVTRGLDALAQKLSETGDAAPGPVAKLANMWKSMSEEDRQQVGASIVAAATSVAMAIPATVAAVRKRSRRSSAAKKSSKNKKDKKEKKEKKKR